MLARPPLGSLARSFGTSASLSKHVSHIGRNPIQYPLSVTLAPTSTELTITGPLGTTSVPLRPYMKLSNPKSNTIALTVEDAEIKEQRQMWGTTRTLIANAIQGMTEGFSVPLYLVGVGFRAAVEADMRASVVSTNVQRINMKVGHSHNIMVPIPPYIKAETPIPTKIILSCTDKHLLGLFAARIREYRKPEPYKGKGIFVGNEVIRIKSVKKK
ncbi:50S ribosomal protein L6 [Leucoagaricus sp. SymC.cos]|nr:50S ribosomal protein L6 [Leucoagaricus sp. SymC.cos]